MLAVTGELDLRQGGEYVPVERNNLGEVVVDESTPGAMRRSIYLRQRRTEIASLLEVFDAPSIVTTCTRRVPSTIPLQSLSLLNSDFIVARAERLAIRLEQECTADTDADDPTDSMVNHAFKLTVGREPDATERTVARRFLETQPSRYPGLARNDSRHRALVDFCQMILASNAFLYVE